MREIGGTGVQLRWVVALAIALMVALACSAAASAQTPADDAYGSPLSSAGSASDGVEENAGLDEVSGNAEAVDGGPELEALPDTGGASLLLGSAVALMLVGTGMLALRRTTRR